MKDNSFKDALAVLDRVKEVKDLPEQSVIDQTSKTIRLALTICDRLKNGEVSEEMLLATEDETGYRSVFRAMTKQMFKETENGL